MRLAVLLLVLAAWAAPVPAAAQGRDEAGLRAADAEQMRIIVEGDAAAQEAFMHPNYMLNGPANDVKRKPELVKMLAEGQMASARFERVVEGVQIHRRRRHRDGPRDRDPRGGEQFGRRAWCEAARTALHQCLSVGRRPLALSGAAGDDCGEVAAGRPQGSYAGAIASASMGARRGSGETPCARSGWSSNALWRVARSGDPSRYGRILKEF